MIESHAHISGRKFDGTFRYLPEPGYTGKDTFAYTYNNYLGESQICYVEITVE